MNRFCYRDLFANSEDQIQDDSGSEEEDEEEQSDNEDDSDSGSKETEEQSDSKSVSEHTDHQSDSKSVSEHTDHQSDSKSVSEHTDLQNDSKSVSEQTYHQTDSKSVPEEIKVQPDNSISEPNPILSDNEREAMVIEYKTKKLQENETPYGSGLISHVLREDGESPWAPVRSLDQIKFNVIEHIDFPLTVRETSRLIRYFPNLTHLTLEQESYKRSTLTQYIRLIRHYSNSLISLNLELEYISREPDEAFEAEVLALFDSINRLPSLQHLTLNVMFNSDISIEPRLTILPRLTTFISRSFLPERLLIASLRQLVDANDGARVRLNCKIEDLTWAQLSELEPRLLARFDRLNIGTTRNDDQLGVKHFTSLRLLCSRLTNLSALKLSTQQMPLTMLARCLSQLPGLIHLHVSFLYRQIAAPIPEEKQTTPPRAIVPLPSVRLLSLDITTFSHHETERLRVEQIFPNLQVLRLKQHPGQCPDCEYNLRNILSRAKHMQVAYCMHLTRLPFSRCANLHTIKLETDEQLECMIRLDLLTPDQL